MKYFRVNTDKLAREDIKTSDLWYHHGMAFAGDFKGEFGKHQSFFKKVENGDGLFMHNSKEGIVGYGVVKEDWDGEVYKGSNRLLYTEELFEYRIQVDWDSKYDRRGNALKIRGFLPYMGYYSGINLEKWDVQKVLRMLENK